MGCWFCAECSLTVSEEGRTWTIRRMLDSIVIEFKDTNFERGVCTLISYCPMCGERLGGRMIEE